MATTTSLLLLRKPATSDNVNVTLDISNNMDLIDALMTAVTPETQAMGDAAVIGSTLQAARVNHKHGMPSFGAVTNLTGTASNGVATTPSRSDHTHSFAFSSQAAGDLFYASSGTALSRLAVGAATTVLHGGASAPAYSQIVNADVDASAAIADSKLATIATADKVSLAALNIDGGTDIGAALADADLMIVDDGAGGTNRKSAMSRMFTYIQAKHAADGQYAFPASQNASADANTLDDYEEGTWTPTIRGLVTAGTQTYSTQTGRYTKIGRLAMVECALVMTAKDAATSGTVVVSGLPFAQGAGSISAAALGKYGNIDLDAGYTQLCLLGADTVLYWYEAGDNVAGSFMAAANVGAATLISASGVYSV